MKHHLLVYLFASTLVAANSSASSYLIQTIAGGDSSADGAPALAAVFSQAEGIAVDAAGTVYVADADGNRIRKITTDGRIWSVAGTGAPGFSGDGGPASVASVSHPYGLALDLLGNLYIADLGNARVRKIGADGMIRTVAGGGTIPPGGNGDGGPATSAQLLQPRNVAVDPDGTLYISDFGANRVYRISGGTLTTMAGTGNAGFSGDYAAAELAQLKSPAGLASDSLGVLYIADSANNRIRKVFQGVISSVYSVTGPTGLATAPNGMLYVAAGGYFGTQFKAISAIPYARDVATDRYGNVYATTGQYVMKVTTDGKVSTIAGSGAPPYFGGDNGPAINARLHAPAGIALDTDGTLYVADTANNRIRKITSAGVIATLAGTGDAGAKGANGPAALAQLNGPRSVAVDSQHNVYVADSGNNLLRKITPGGIIIDIGLQLKDPEYVALDPTGALYIVDSGNNRILKLTASGTVSTVALAVQPSAVAIDGNGNVYLSDSRRISKITPAGTITTVLDGLNSPRGLALTPQGDLIFAETGVNVIRKLSASGVVSTIAGTGVAGFSGDSGPAAVAQLSGPADVFVDLSGTIWIADSGNNRIRTLSPSVIADAVGNVTIANAATLVPGPIAPGEIVTIFGSGFDPNQTQLLFDRKQATVFYVGANQINALAPLDLAPNSITDVGVMVAGVEVAGAAAQIVSAAPGIFTTANGAGQAAAVNEDGSINSESSPADRGSIISLFGTGQGQSSNNVSLKIGGYIAELLYAGPAPGFPGLMQINARVPGGFLAPGVQPVALSVGNVSSQAGVTIAVH